MEESEQPLWPTYVLQGYGYFKTHIKHTALPAKEEGNNEAEGK